MKKFYTLLTLFLGLTLGASAQTFSEGKAFTISTNGRGAWKFEGDKIVSRALNANDDAFKFALIEDGGKKYLYNYGAQKFVAAVFNAASANVLHYSRLSVLPQYEAKKLTATTPDGDFSSKFQFVDLGGRTYTANMVTGNTNKLQIDSWTTEDAGNRLKLENVELPVNADAILKAAYRTVLEQVLPVYNLNVAAPAADATLEDLKAAWASIVGTEFVVPKSGFYRFKGFTGHYVSAVEAGQDMATVAAGPDAVFYFDAETSHIVGLKQGLSAKEWKTGTVGQADAFVFKMRNDGAVSVKGETRFWYDDATAVINRTTVYTEGYSDFVLEPVQNFNVTLVDNFATFYTPVAVKVEGAKVYKAKLNGTKLSASAVEGYVPANTAFMMKGDGATATLTIGEEGAAADFSNNAFVGGVKAEVVAGKKTYFLSTAGKFAQLADGQPRRGFRAFVELPVASSVQAFTLDFDNVTGITTATEDATDAPIFDLSGRRVVRTQQGGVYLQNGKKFIAR